jgi:hypothetical protein
MYKKTVKPRNLRLVIIARKVSATPAAEKIKKIVDNST